MPGTSSLDLQRQVVRVGPRLPVTIITGHDEPGIQARGRAHLRKLLEAGDVPGGP